MRHKYFWIPASSRIGGATRATMERVLSEVHEQGDTTILLPLLMRQTCCGLRQDLLIWSFGPRNPGRSAALTLCPTGTWGVCPAPGAIRQRSHNHDVVAPPSRPDGAARGR